VQTEYKPRPAPTWAEKQFKKLEQKAEGEKAYAEYRTKQAAALANMRHLRSVRLSRPSEET
jgi:hypothetical protein